MFSGTSPKLGITGALFLCVLLAMGQQPQCVCDSLLVKASAAVELGHFNAADSLLDLAMPIAERQGDVDLQGRVLLNRGLVSHARGDYVNALDMYLRTQRIREATDDQMGLAEVYNNIGSVHQYKHDYKEALLFYRRSLAIRERLNDEKNVAVVHNNLGTLYEEMGKQDSALYHHTLSLQYWVVEQDSLWQALSHEHIGACHIKLDDPRTARAHLTRALALCESKPRSHLRGIMFHEMGLTYLAEGKGQEALEWCEKGMQLSIAVNRLGQKEQCAECLYRAHEMLGHKQKSLEYFKLWVNYRDSLYNGERIKELTRVELLHEFAKRQYSDSLKVVRNGIIQRESVKRERDQKKLFLVIGVAAVLLAGGLWNRLAYMRRSRAEIQQERDRSDTLLRNILPDEVAAELKAKGRANARRYEQVSILFTDFKDFTHLSERMSPEELVEELNACFKAFDTILARHGVEKIKTIGDAYMGAGGLPTPQPDSALRTVLAVLEMQAFIKSYGAMRVAAGKPPFEMRSGVHTGPIVAGVVGDRKFQYDIWGDTVNIASRIETSGETGRVNISQDTYNLLRGDQRLKFTPRGLVQVKGKGAMAMYFVSLASDGAPDNSSRADEAEQNAA